MSIQKDRMTDFWNAVRALTYSEMMEVAEELSTFVYLENVEDTSDHWFAQVLNDSAEGKPTGPATRGV